MGQLIQQDEVAINDGGVVSVSELNQRYTETMAELQRFSQINPGDIVDHNEMDNAEAALLDYEAYLLDRASHIPLQTEDDISTLMDIWAKVSKATDEDRLQSDKIVKNIFRHLSRG